MKSFAFVVLALASFSLAAPSNSSRNRRYPQKFAKRCTGTIASLSDVESAQECDTIIVLINVLLGAGAKWLIKLS